MAIRFSETISKIIIGYFDIFIEEAGYTQENFPHGFSFADDNCCLLTPDLYELCEEYDSLYTIRLKTNRNLCKIAEQFITIKDNHDWDISVYGFFLFFDYKSKHI